MTLDQGLAFGLIIVTIGLFVWGRLPYDLVAMTALLVGIAIGVVPEKHAFEGFSDDIIIIIAAALVVSAAIARSGVIEALMRPILPRLKTTSTQVPVLVGCVLLLSMVTKNVGALAILMPIALQVARRRQTSPSSLLMPMAAASLTGASSRWSAPRPTLSSPRCAPTCSASLSPCSTSRPSASASR